MDGIAARLRSSEGWEIVLPCSAAISVSLVLYIFAGYVWGSAAAAAFLVAGCWLTCRYFLKAAPPEPSPLQLQHAAAASLMRAVAVQAALGQQLNVSGGDGSGGLSLAEIEGAIPVFEYRRKAAAAAPAEAEQCAVCINVVRDGEAVRRLPACAHTFHAPCIDVWLRAHATCPMCRADVKVAAVGLPPAESSAAAW